MNHMLNRMFTLTAASVLAFAAACGNTADGVKKDADKVAEKSMEATAKASDAVDDAIQTVDIKAALMADTRVDATGINVNTDADKKVVTLNGTVPTDAQRTLAAQVATDKAKGLSIVNKLTVVKKP